jgi:hypothetical protein
MTMTHSKTKASILTVASTIIATAAIRIAAGSYVEAGILVVIAMALFGAYEYLNFKEIPVDAGTITEASEQVADDIESEMNSRDGK